MSGNYSQKAVNSSTGNFNLETFIEEEFFKGVEPDSYMSVSEWADKNRMLSSKSASEPGRWRTKRTPYLKEIMDYLSPKSPIQKVVFMKVTQIGGTECGNNWIGYIMHKAPGPIMAVSPTVEMAKHNSRQRIDPLIEDCPALKGLVSSPRSRDKGNTMLSTDFMGGLFLTAGVDVQKDRIECEVVDWGRQKQSWSVEYFVLQGDTAKPDVWRALEKVLMKDYSHASGITMPMRVMCVGSGYASQDVYSFVRQFNQAVWGGAGARANAPRTVVVIKGQSRDTVMILSTSKADTKKKGLKVWNVSGPVIKTELYRWLKMERIGDNATDFGRCHFLQYGEECFKQLTAERQVVKISNGYPKPVWEKDPTRRNEALDCRVYARAGAAIYGLDRFSEKAWQELESVIPQDIQEKPIKKKTRFIQMQPTKVSDPWL